MHSFTCIPHYGSPAQENNAMTTPEIGIIRSGATVRIHIDRPAKRNAITTAMYAAIAAAITEAEADPQTCAIIISGEGATFCAGNDLADFVGNRPDTEDAAVHRFLRAIANTPLMLIAAVQGRAIGIGTTLLLHCDFVFAEPDAVLQMPFVDLALVPEAASSLLVPRLVGHLRAAEFLLLGEPIAAERAAALGFVTRIVPAGTALAEAEAVAARLAAKPAAALRRTKKLLKSSTQEVAARMAEENREFAAQLKTPELAATIARFFASRKGAAA
jgi:enoyl-CoA hydratase/carnithine racemase